MNLIVFLKGWKKQFWSFLVFSLSCYIGDVHRGKRVKNCSKEYHFTKMFSLSVHY
jgi:hypothetical protein